MRLLHPTTIKILASHPEFPKTHLSHAWSEVFKWKASGQKHPKCFIHDDIDVGVYLRYLNDWCKFAGVNINEFNVASLGIDIFSGFTDRKISISDIRSYFDSNYLFSDAVSLYFKGTNIFTDIFGDQWRKYVPVESLKEIKRQVDKTLSKK